MYSVRNRSGWAALSSISVVLAAPVAAQTLDAATIARYQARLADNESGRFNQLSASSGTNA
jgi:soluble lytic murein transglycosylase